MKPIRPISALLFSFLAACSRHDGAASPSVPVGSSPQFETRSEIPTGVPFHADHAVADFDGDLNPDIAVCGFDGDLQILLGSGPVFTPAQSLPLGGVMIWLDQGDFDRDGDVDLVVLRRDVQELNVLFNDGNAQFTLGPTFTVGVGSLQVLAADATDDGLLDLMVSRPTSPEIQVFIGDGFGAFVPGQSISLPGGGQSFTMTTGDVTRDAVDDLVVADPTLDRVLIFPGIATLSEFSKDPTILSVAGSPAAVSVGDLNGDGFADIAVSAYEQNRFVVVTSFQQIPGPALYDSMVVQAEGRASLTTIGDVTGDGLNDLVACVIDRASIVVVPQRQNGMLGTPLQFDSTGMPMRPSVVDVDRNGHDDLLVLSGLADRLNLWLSDELGSLMGAQNWDCGLYEAAIAVAVDLDNDGQPEVVVGDPHETRLSVLASGTDMSMQLAQVIDLGASVQMVRTADFDQDGRMDLLVSVYGGVKIVRNLSTPGSIAWDIVPGAGLVFAAGEGAFGASATDLDGDGDLDIAVADYTGGAVRILRGNGTAFDYSALAESIPVGSGPVDVVAADFTGDGAIDLAVSRRLMSDILLLENDGAGSFSPGLSVPVGAAPNFLVSADFNADGRADIAVANGDEDTVSVLFGGAQGFAVADYAAGRFPSALLAEDLTGDGFADILVAARLGEDFRVLVGDGAGNFANVFPFPGTLGASAVSLADIDRDGDQDLVIASVVSDRVSVVKNVRAADAAEAAR